MTHHCHFLNSKKIFALTRIYSSQYLNKVLSTIKQFLEFKGYDSDKFKPMQITMYPGVHPSGLHCWNGSLCTSYASTNNNQQIRLYNCADSLKLMKLQEIMIHECTHCYQHRCGHLAKPLTRLERAEQWDNSPLEQEAEAMRLEFVEYIKTQKLRVDSTLCNNIATLLRTNLMFKHKITFDVTGNGVVYFDDYECTPSPRTKE